MLGCSHARQQLARLAPHIHGTLKPHGNIGSSGLLRISNELLVARKVLQAKLLNGEMRVRVRVEERKRRALHVAVATEQRQARDRKAPS